MDFTDQITEQINQQSSSSVKRAPALQFIGYDGYHPGK
jgi:hypothetical protein